MESTGLLVIASLFFFFGFVSWNLGGVFGKLGQMRWTITAVEKKTRGNHWK
jgi:hypothetical protein